MMDIRFQAGGSGRWKADAALAFFFEGEGPEQAASALEQAAPWLGIAPALRDYRGRKGEMTVMYGPAAMDLPRVVALGLGAREKAGVQRLRYPHLRAFSPPFLPDLSCFNETP